MTALAFLWRVLVEQYLLALKLPVIFVAPRAKHILVEAGQGELRPFVVIKQRRLPLGRVMAILARCDAIFLKLLAMDVFVAAFAFDRRCREVRFHQLGFHVRRLVAIDTRRCPVRAQQRERGFGVIKDDKVFPVLAGMASLAAKRRSVRARLLHALGELPLVRVFVAGFAIQCLPVIEHHRLRHRIRMFRLFMAIRTGNRNMSARQNKPRFLVPLQSKCRRLPSPDRMALLALVPIRLIHKLAIMRIRMAIGAILELHFVERVLALRNMALGAFHLEVLSLQRIVGRVVVFGRKRRRLPPVHSVARRTFNALRPLRKLPVVRIRQMAIRTFRKRNLFLEISTLMARAAIDGGMFAQ